MLCCVCYRNPPTIFRGKAAFCSQCDDVKPFLEKTAEENAEDAKAQEALEKWREARRKKKGHKNGPNS